MEAQLLILGLTVLGAAMLQAATGMGFGVVAGPVLLVLLDSAGAIQISVALSLLIALVLTPVLWGHVHRPLLWMLLAGALPGLGLGVWVYLLVPLPWLKLLAALAVGGTLLFVAGAPTRAGASGSRPAWSRAGAVVSGLAAGVMGGALAMPGPIPAAWMARGGLDRFTLRATLLAMFVVAYLAALGMQAAMAGIAEQVWVLCLKLAPATLLGVAIGRVLPRWISERTFRRILMLVLAATALSLLYAALPHIL